MVLAVRALPLHPEVGVGAQRRVPIQHFLALFGLEPQSAGNCVPWAVGAGAADVITASASPSWGMAAASMHAGRGAPQNPVRSCLSPSKYPAPKRKRTTTTSLHGQPFPASLPHDTTDPTPAPDGDVGVRT